MSSRERHAIIADIAAARVYDGDNCSTTFNTSQYEPQRAEARRVRHEPVDTHVDTRA